LKPSNNKSDGTALLDGGSNRGERNTVASGDQEQHWTAAGLLEAERKFRKVEGYRQLSVLRAD